MGPRAHQSSVASSRPTTSKGSRNQSALNGSKGGRESRCRVTDRNYPAPSQSQPPMTRIVLCQKSLRLAAVGSVDEPIQELSGCDVGLGDLRRVYIQGHRRAGVPQPS